MKALMIFCFIISLLPFSISQTTLLTEDFETDGEGDRYTTNHFFDSCNDLFERSTNGGMFCLSNEPTNVSGVHYWAGEDTDVTSGGTGILTLDPVTVSGYSLEMKVLLAVGRPNDFRFETDDELLFQYNMDGGGWNTFAAFYGSFEGSGLINGDLTQDADFNGMGDPGGLEIESSDFVDFTFSIPATGNSLQIRFVMGQNQGTEEIMLDNIRIIGNVPLPVELSEFQVQPIEEDRVRITWQTSSEINNEFFILEKSKDGSSWEKVEKIRGAGNSNETKYYSIMDSNPFWGVSYYRLKQVDFDGSYEYSDIKSIQLGFVDYENKVFPNPTFSNKINIDILNDDTEVLIFDNQGRIVNREFFQKGNSELLLNDYAPGLYFIKFINRGKIETQKLIVMYY